MLLLSNNLQTSAVTIVNTLVSLPNSGTTYATSADEGLTWVSRTLPLAGNWVASQVNGQIIALASGSNRSLSSTDGVTWTQGTLPTTGAWLPPVWNGSVYCSLASSSNKSIVSTDGVNWTLALTAPTATWVGLAWNGVVFCAIASGSAIAATSTDGQTWTARTLPSSSPWGAIAWNGSVFSIIGSATTATGQVAATSTDGITWVAQTFPDFSIIKNLVWANGKFIAIDSDLTSFGNGLGAIFLSSDGITWSVNYLVLDSTKDWGPLVWDGAWYITIDSATSTKAVSLDGVTWTESAVALPSIGTAKWTALASFTALIYPTPINVPTITSVSGAASFSVTASSTYQFVINNNIFITGQKFDSRASITGDADYGIGISGNTFATVPSIYGGVEVDGSTFTSAAVISFTPANEFQVKGYGFNTTAAISYIPSTNTVVNGRSFTGEGLVFGGSVVKGSSFVSVGKAVVTASLSCTVAGRGFNTQLTSYTVYQPKVTVTGTGFKSVLFYSKIAGTGFSSTPYISFDSVAANTAAFVMNTVTNSVSRYTNYPFMHIASIAGVYYGVKPDGLYKLTGTSDIILSVNGSITTKDTDFEAFQTKNVPYIYLNGDDFYAVTSIVDEVAKPKVHSSFGGRKVKLARGSKGRYWAFKIEGIQRLQGVEYLPDQLHRRVK